MDKLTCEESYRWRTNTHRHNSERAAVKPHLFCWIKVGLGIFGEGGSYLTCIEVGEVDGA